MTTWEYGGTWYLEGTQYRVITDDRNIGAEIAFVWDDDDAMRIVMQQHQLNAIRRYVSNPTATELYPETILAILDLKCQACGGELLRAIEGAIESPRLPPLNHAIVLACRECGQVA